MSLPPALKLVDEIWPELRRHLEWSQGFSLFFLFGRPRALAAIRERLVDALRLRSLPLQEIAPDSAGAAPEEVVGSVLDASRPLNEIGAPVWVALDRHADDPAWNEARGRILASLNERRYLVERNVQRPLLMVLPVGYRPTALEIAPDLWAVRTFSADVGDVGYVADATGLADRIGRPDAVPGPRVVRDGDLPASVVEWDRIKTIEPERIALSVGWQAADDAEEARNPVLAHRIAREAVEVARARQRHSPLRAMDSARELSVSLGRLGEAAYALRRLDDAEGAYRESLDLARRLLELGGRDAEGAARRGRVAE